MREDWQIKKLGEIGKICMCKRIYKRQTSSTGEIPFYKIGTFGKSPNAFIPKKMFEEYKLKYSYPKKGQILISASGTIGRRVIFNGEPSYFQDSNIVWIDNDDKFVSNKYLYIFYGYCNWNPSKGAVISRLYNDDLRRIEIPIPPLPEQKAIVKILDKAFAVIDQAKANIERNIENAKELFQSRLNEIFTQTGNGWEEKELPNLVNPSCTLSYGIVQPGSEFKNGLPIVRPTDMKKKGINIEKLKKIDPEKANSYSRTKLNGDELLLCVRGETGRIALVPLELKGANVTRGIVPISFNEDIIKLKFGYYQFQTANFIKQIKAKTYGAALMQINIRDVKKLQLKVPSLKTQIDLIRILEDLDNSIRAIIEKYSHKLIILNNLKKSILQQAFAGELTKDFKS